MDKRPIGVFDSGLGGLTAVKELKKLLPGEDIIYFGDTGRVPYGGRSRDTIIKYARQDIAFLRSFDIKAVVIACGTVSTNALDVIADDYDIPVLGVVGPAARAAAQATESGRIGIIGTSASIKSGAYDRMIRSYMPGAELTSEACPLFVPLVENGRTKKDDQVLRLVAEEYMAPMKNAGVDTMILGCTHYPLIRDVISDIMGGVSLIDPGAETVRELSELLSTEDMLAGREKGTYRYFVSDSADGFETAASVFMESDLNGTVTQISLEDF